MPVLNPNSIARLERDRLVLIRETGRSLRILFARLESFQSFLRFSAISGISGTAREREASVKPLDRMSFT